MALIKVDAEPAEVGFDASRLARIDRHFRRYVDDGLLAGWTVAVSRRGRVAYLSHQGMRDLEAGLPVTDDTIWRIYSMTKPITSVAAMMLYEEGAFELTDPVARFIPSFADARVVQGRAGAEPVDGPGHRARARLAPAHPHLRAHLRLPPRAPGRRDVPPARLRVLRSAGRGPRHRVRPARRAPAAVPARHRVELRGLDRRARPGRRGRVGAAARRVPRRARPRPAGHGRDRVVGRRAGPRPAGGALHARTGRRPRGQHGPRRGGDPPAGAARRRRRAGVDGGGLPPLHPDAAARR